MRGWRLLHRGSDCFWVGAVPTGWPHSAWWTDIAANAVVDGPRGGRMEDHEAPQEVLYAPPVPPDSEARRRRAMEPWFQDGRRVVVQVEAHIQPPPVFPDGAPILLWDPTSALLHNTIDDLAVPPGGAWALWPLIPGVSDVAARVTSAAKRAAEAGVAGMVPVAPAMSPRARRLVVDHHGEEVFEAVHHGGRVRVAPAAAAIVDAGLEFQPPRPARAGESEAHARACSVLGWLGDLYLRLGREERGQRVLKAQRWLETAPWDLEVIARDGHLDLVPELGGEAGEVLRELLNSGTSTRFESVRAEYLAG